MATTEISPVGTRAQGATKVGFFAGALSAAGAISLASDIGHAGFLNLSFYIPGNTIPITGSQNKGTDQRLGSTQLFEALGVKNWTVPDLQYIEDVTSSGSGSARRSSFPIGVRGTSSRTMIWDGTMYEGSVRPT